MVENDSTKVWDRVGRQFMKFSARINQSLSHLAFKCYYSPPNQTYLP